MTLKHTEGFPSRLLITKSNCKLKDGWFSLSMLTRDHLLGFCTTGHCGGADGGGWGVVVELRLAVRWFLLESLLMR